MISVSATETVSTTLLLALRANDRGAFERLTLLFAPTVRNRLRRMGVPGCDIADLEQNTFLRVWRGLPRFQRLHADASFRSWLMTIVRHVASDYFDHRSHQERSVGPERMSVIAGPNVEEASDRSSMANDEMVLELHRMLEMVRGDFSETTYSVFVRYWFEGHDTERIARELGMRKGTVREARNRVLRRIRDEFAGLYNTSEWPFAFGGNEDDLHMSIEG